MKTMLLSATVAIAAAALYSAPAVAMDGGFGRHASPPGGLIGRPAVSCPGFPRDSTFRGDRRDRRDRRVNCNSNVVMDWYGGEWALYNNRSWAPDSYNDWWHENPSRAYPAWMQRNQDCARKWYAGDTLTC
jgi:hypothetical protein